MYTATELQMLRVVDPNAKIPGIDTTRRRHERSQEAWDGPRAVSQTSAGATFSDGHGGSLTLAGVSAATLAGNPRLVKFS